MTVTVVVILATITTLTLVGQQKETRDTTRNSKATVISESLEKYYEDNGEYPSVASLVNQPVTNVKQKLNIADKDVLVFPNANNSSQVSLVPESAGASSQQVVYVGSPNTPTCQSDANGYCTGYQLRYETEAEKQLVTLKSRRNPFVPNVETCSGSDCLAAPSRPSVTGAANGSSLVRFSVTTPSICSTGTVEYKIRYNTSSPSESAMPDWTTVSWSSGTTLDVSKGTATNFHSQARARCVLSGASGPVSANSEVHTYTVPSSPPPATPNPSATATGTSTIQLTWPAVSGATSYSVTGSGNASSCTSSGCTVSGLSAGTYYSFNVHAINSGGTSSPGSAGATTNTASPTCYTPSTPSISASTGSTSSINLSWSGSTGTSPITYYVYYGTSSAASTYYTSTSSTSPTVSGLSSGTTYYFKIYASNSCGNTGYSNTASATTSTPPPSGSAPSAPSVSVTALSAVSLRISWGASSGTSPISYNVSGSGLSSCSSSPCTATGLNPSQTYTYTVTASNSYGSANGSGSGTTQSTSLVVSASSTNIWGNNTLSYGYTNGYTPSNNVASGYNFSGPGSLRGSKTTTSLQVDRNNCAATGTFTVTGPDTKSGSVGVDRQYVPTGTPNPYVSGGPWSNGARLSWNELSTASYYPQERNGGAGNVSVQSIQPPTDFGGQLMRDTYYNFKVWGANCAGLGNMGNVGFRTLP